MLMANRKVLRCVLASFSLMGFMANPDFFLKKNWDSKWCETQQGDKEDPRKTKGSFKKLPYALCHTVLHASR